MCKGGNMRIMPGLEGRAREKKERREGEREGEAVKRRTESPSIVLFYQGIPLLNPEI